MTPEFSLRENSGVVPPAEKAESRIAPLFLEGPTPEFSGSLLPENSGVSGFVPSPSDPPDLLLSLLH